MALLGFICIGVAALIETGIERKIQNKNRCLQRDSNTRSMSAPVKTYANNQPLLEEKSWHTVGSNQQPLDYSPFAIQTELRRTICRVGFKLLLILYNAIVSYNVTRHCFKYYDTCLMQLPPGYAVTCNVVAI